MQTKYFDTKQLILMRLDSAPDRTLPQNEMTALLRYRFDGQATLRALVREGVVVRGKASTAGRRGRRPTLYTLPAGKSGGKR